MDERDHRERREHLAAERRLDAVSGSGDGGAERDAASLDELQARTLHGTGTNAEDRGPPVGGQPGTISVAATAGYDVERRGRSPRSGRRPGR